MHPVCEFIRSTRDSTRLSRIHDKVASDFAPQTDCRLDGVHRRHTESPSRRRREVVILSRRTGKREQYIASFKESRHGSRPFNGQHTPAGFLKAHLGTATARTYRNDTTCRQPPRPGRSHPSKRSPAVALVSTRRPRSLSTCGLFFSPRDRPKCMHGLSPRFHTQTTDDNTPCRGTSNDLEGLKEGASERGCTGATPAGKTEIIIIVKSGGN